MSGAIAIRQLLVGTPAVTEIVPPNEAISRIVAGLLARDVPLPALAIRTLSSTERKTIRPGTTRQVTDRIQVIAVSKQPEDLVPLIKAVSSACGHKFPAVEGLTRVVVLPAGQGEDFVDEDTALHMRPHDFTVSYGEPR